MTRHREEAPVGTEASPNSFSNGNGTEPSGKPPEPDGETADYDPFAVGENEPTVVARYNYLDEKGQTLFQVRRWEPGRDGGKKSFTQSAWNGHRWVRGLNGTKPVLYRLPELIASPPDEEVWIVEGEKDVHTLVERGCVATCNSGGADKWKPEYAEDLRGRLVRIVVDRDEPGKKWARAVCDSLRGVARGVKLFQSAHGKDVTDHIEHFSYLDGKQWYGSLERLPPDHLVSPAADRQKPARAEETSDAVPAALAHVLVALVAAQPAQMPVAPSVTGGDWQVCCPVHEDTTPSATVNVGGDRPIVFHCFAGCTQDDFFDWLVRHGVSHEELMDTKGPSTASTLRIYTAEEMSTMALEPPTWVVNHILVDNTFGPLAGERKSLKTYLMLLLSVAVAKGGRFLGNFPVAKAGPVLTFNGEGGRDPHIRRLRRVCDAMNVKLEDLPLVNVYDTAPLTSDTFRRTLELSLEEHRPIHTNLDPLYMFHPHDVPASDLYKRGQMLGAVGTTCVDAGSTLLVSDHFNKTGQGNGLSRISMSGWAEAADTWILLRHYRDPQVEEGRFFLTMEVGSRQWGGITVDVDLSIGKLDPTTLDHDGRITFEVKPHDGDRAESRGLAKKEALIMDVLNDAPFEKTQTEVLGAVGGKREQAKAAFDHLITENCICCREIDVTRSDGKPMKRQVWGLK